MPLLFSYPGCLERVIQSQKTHDQAMIQDQNKPFFVRACLALLHCSVWSTWTHSGRAAIVCVRRVWCLRRLHHRSANTTLIILCVHCIPLPSCCWCDVGCVRSCHWVRVRVVVVRCCGVRLVSPLFSLRCGRHSSSSHIHIRLSFPTTLTHPPPLLTICFSLLITAFAMSGVLRPSLALSNFPRGAFSAVACLNFLVQLGVC